MYVAESGKVEISEEEIPGSRRSMPGYFLTYSRLYEGEPCYMMVRLKAFEELLSLVSASSRSRGGDVTLYVFGINQMNLPTPL